MKKLYLILTVLCVNHAHAVTPDEVVNNMQKAAATTVAKYKNGGIASLVQISEDCYKDLNKFRFYCIYLDLAARHVADRDGAGVRFTPEKYFVDEEFLSRTSEIFIRSNMNMDQSNEYLAMVTPIINKFVDTALAAKK